MHKKYSKISFHINESYLSLGIVLSTMYISDKRSNCAMAANMVTINQPTNRTTCKFSYEALYAINRKIFEDNSIVIKNRMMGFLPNLLEK